MKKLHVIYTIAALGLLLGLALLLSKAMSLNPNSQSSALVDKPAFSFNLQLLQGQELLPKKQSLAQVQLEDFKGMPLILNFWASWCEGCQEEAHTIEAFWKKYRDTGIRVLGVAIQDEEKNILEFTRSLGKTYMIALDSEGKTSINFGVTGVPETFFIDAKGVIRHKEVGPVTFAMLEEHGLSLLK